METMGWCHQRETFQRYGDGDPCSPSAGSASTRTVIRPGREAFGGWMTSWTSIGTPSAGECSRIDKHRNRSRGHPISRAPHHF